MLSSDLVTTLVARLREELQEYGEILALLDQQQDSVMGRAADAVLQSVVAIQDQMGVIHAARLRREEALGELAESLRQPRDTSFAVLLPVLPEMFRSGVAALVRENNELLIRVQQRARQNHLLLSRSMEMMQQFINALLPAAAPKTYQPDGQIATGEGARRALYEAIV